MEVALCSKLLTLLKQYAYILLGKVRTLLELADEF